MRSAGVDAFVAIGLPNVHYLCGAEVRTADSARSHYERIVAVGLAGDPCAHVFTPFPEGMAPEHPASHRHGTLAVEYGDGVASLSEFLQRVLGREGSTIAVDEYTAAMFEQLAASLPGHRFTDGAPLVGGARLCKTDDELQCLRRAQRINEEAMRDVLPRLRPGVRQCELTARFLERIHELGASSNEIDPIWQPLAPRLADNPFSTNGDVPFPRASTDRFLREGEVIWVDTGITCHGYASDFGRTWIVGRDPLPNDEQRAAFQRWRDVVRRVLDATRPGASGADLTRAACLGEEGRPWMDHFYLIHGVGLNSAEMPLIGTDLGAAFDEKIELAPGMVLVLEPAIWCDGHAGYRSEEIVAVTEEGWVSLAHFPYTPFEEGDT